MLSGNASMSAVETAVETKAGTVLIVDDDRALRFALSAYLRTQGYEVALASNGSEALAEIGRNRPDIIILDVAMPGMDGIELLHELKKGEGTWDIPVVMLTGRTSESDLVSGLEYGADEYVVKPFGMAELMARLRNVQRLAATRRRLAEANDRLAREVSDTNRRLNILYRLARRLNEVESEQEALDLTIEAVREAAGAGRISIMLPEPDGQHLYCARAVGLPEHLAASLRVRVDEGIVGNVFSTGRTLVANARSDVEARHARYSSDAFVSVPLISTTLKTRDEVIGVLNATDRPDDAPFTPEEIECIRSISDMAAVTMHNLLRRSRLENFVQVLLLTIGRLAEHRDDNTAAHLERVQRYANRLARQLQQNPRYRSVLTDAYIHELTLATPLHDIGKVGIPDDVLLKRGPLTPKEFEVMKRHVEIGRQTIAFAAMRTGPLTLLAVCLDIVSGHHEKYDGSGYPAGLRGEEIPLAARIVALADAYDAITSRRPYKPAQSHETAVRIIRSESGRHFDPAIVDAFLECEDQFDRIRRETPEEEAEEELAAVAG